MSSSVFFRFKSQKEPSRVTFDGTGISVFELKREIITQNKLGDGLDFELIITSEDTNEEYDDDTTIIPRSTTVIARRLPAMKAGRGGAARYVLGKMPQNAKNSHRQEVVTTKPTASVTAHGLTAMNGAHTEDERIAAMFKMGADDWAQQQQQMANAAPVFRGGSVKGKPQNVPDHPPPPGYVCYRCGEKGHWIMECPTNNDPAFDGRPRIKRTTGIPKSFLKTVEKPTTLMNDGITDSTKQPTGVMVNSEGEWVIAEPDQAAWDKFQAQAKVSAAAENAAAQGSKQLRDRGLECKIDKRLFVDPTKTPCCHTTYCHECIQNALLDNDLCCPHCSTDNVPVDDLIPDEEMAANIRKYQEERAAAGESVKEEPDITIKQQHNENPAKYTRSPLTVHAGKPALPQKDLQELAVLSKKRPAQSELENGHKSRGPTELRPEPNAGKLATGKVQNQNLRSSNPNRETFFTNTSNIDTSTFNPMTFPNMNGFMGMGMPMSMAPPMGMNTAMQSPMMVQNAQFMGNEWSNMWGFPPQNMNIGETFQQGKMYNGGSNLQNMQNPMANNYMNSISANGTGTIHRFANQQRSNNEEESAYFRKPVNPNRQQNRRNWNQNRPADYREI
ncbi:MAG: hypothetical protein Q9217_002867 [Psora testacea]